MAIVIFIWATFRRFRTYMDDPEFRGLLYSVLVLLAFGTALFHYLEGWNLLDSLYFSVVSLTTVGYGDFTPTSDWGRAWAIIYILMGIGILSSFIGMVVRKRRERIRAKSNESLLDMRDVRKQLESLMTHMKSTQMDQSTILTELAKTHALMKEIESDLSDA